MTGLSGVASIMAAKDHACAVTLSRELYCWGDNDRGQLGNNAAPTDLTTPALIALPSGARAVQVSGGENHTCAVAVISLASSLGVPFCWGADPAGQIGDGAIGGGDVAMPSPVVGFVRLGVESVSTGLDHSCALTSRGHIACWGDDDDGQLGNGGSNTDSATPSLVVEN